MLTYHFVNGELTGARQRELLDQARRARLGRRIATAATPARRRRTAGVALAAAAAGLALVLTGCGGGSGAAGVGSASQGTTGTGQPSGGVSDLVGTWDGPALANTGSCGTGSGTFVFGSDGSYTFSGSYDPAYDCAGYTDTGTYQVSGDVITFLEASGGTAADTFSVTGDDLELCDSSAGPCNQFQRQ